ncbi:MAG: hypothetical protein KDB27_19920, partial [Planctomycetales bacterium]|nr:hypothetical protein [Planctomycetales bacterium]
ADVYTESKLNKRVARSWFSGANSYPFSDPLKTAYLVYGYLRQFASLESTAKSKESISSALSLTSHDNISHVVDSLAKADLIESGNNKFYAPHESAILSPVDLNGNVDAGLKNRVAELRSILYGEFESDGRKSRFERRGFRIYYDLAFAAENSITPRFAPRNN